MKQNIVTAIANRDAGALAKMSQTPAGGKIINPEAEQLVDALFRQLKQVFPAAAQTNLKSPDDERYAKQQWIAAFAENGIRTKEQLSAGMRWARASKNPFWPSPGQFIEGCRQNDPAGVGLPDADELYGMIKKFGDNRYMYRTPEEYPWKNNACYWMVTKLYALSRASGLTESELRKRCGQELAGMTVRIRSGENIPVPRVMIPKMHIPVPKDKALAHIADIKAKFGFRTA